MAKPYTITITNGEGSENITTCNYTFEASVIGYNNDSIEPATQLITSDTSEYNFTISATGTLILHVTEEGIEDGTPIEGASFVRCDAEGNTYGEPVTSDGEGNATFNNVPYADNDGSTVYFKQTESDENHDFELEMYNEVLVAESTTVQIFNPPVSSKTIKLTDANYAGLPISAGEITLS